MRTRRLPLSNAAFPRTTSHGRLTVLATRRVFQSCPPTRPPRLRRHLRLRLTCDSTILKDNACVTVDGKDEDNPYVLFMRAGDQKVGGLHVAFA
jgi:hypothetical protein